MENIYSNPIDDCVESGIQFESVKYAFEIFPAPLPDEVDGEPVENFQSLTLNSWSFGFNELFLPEGSSISGNSGGRCLQFDIRDFIGWQLLRSTPMTLLYLASKIDAPLFDIFDAEEEISKDNEYSPEEWLNPYGKSEDELYLAFEYIERLKKEKPMQLVNCLVDAMLDKDTGVFAYAETDVDEGNFQEVREIYADWEVPLMLVYQGSFETYIDKGNGQNLMRDNWDVHRATVRNYDEGEI